MIEIGSSAGGGIERQYSMCGIDSLRRTGESPIGTPSATPAITPIVKPRPRRSRLGTTFVPNCEKSHMCWKSTRIVESRGNLIECALAVQSCHPRSSSSGTAISAASFSVR